VLVLSWSETAVGVTATTAHDWSPLRNVEELAVPEAKRAVAIVPDVTLEPFNAVRPVPVPVGANTSVPITTPKLVLAPEAVVLPVPPEVTARAFVKDTTWLLLIVSAVTLAVCKAKLPVSSAVVTTAANGVVCAFIVLGIISPFD
jgi:hypothetical protein